MKSSNEKVGIYHRINRLKLKAGIPINDDKLGYIDPSAVKRAQKRIEEKEQEYPETVKNVLEQLTSAWEHLKTAPEDEFKITLDQIYNFANNIKDLTATYHHDLMHHFSLSLRDFCERFDAQKEEHHTIVQAHIDVMWITHDEKLRGEDGPKAQELKTVVAKAIEKFS